MTTEWTTDGKPTSRVLSGLSRRFWGGIGTRILESGALDDLTARSGQTADEAARQSEYYRRQCYQQNIDLYGRLYRAGLYAADMPVEWNPVPAVIQFYISNTLTGELTVQPTDEEADGEALAAAVEQIWRWSNFPALKRELTRTAATMGDTFLKVAERRLDEESPATAVYLQDVMPHTVRWWDADERDFLTAIRIDTPRLTSVFTGTERRHTLVEVWRKQWPDGFAGVRYYETQPNYLLDDTRPDRIIREIAFAELGYDFIPIVWARVDTPWRAQVAGVDRYNALAWQAARLNRPLAIVNGNGTDAQGRPLAPPTGMSAGLEAIYGEAGDGVMGIVEMPGAATLGWSGTPIDFASLNERMREVRQGVIDALPEYRVTTIDASTKIATETLELLLSHAGQRVLEVREGLERALVRAQMMAISVAQLAELPGFEESAIGTYDDGLTEHELAERPVFGKSDSKRAEEATMHINNGVALGGAYRLAGYTDTDVDAALQADEVHEGVTQ